MQGQTKILQIEGINANAFLNAVEDLLTRQLSAIQKPSPDAEIEFITRNQVAEIFGITLPTVHAWTNTGILIAYKIGNKTRFKKSEVFAAATRIKQKRGSHE